MKVFSHSRYNRLLTCSTKRHLLEPNGVAYDLKTGHMAVADRGTACVYVHTPRGHVQDVLTARPKDLETFTITSRPSSSASSLETPEIICPAYVAFDHNRNVIVSDTGLCSVYCFDAKDGDLKWAYGQPGGDDYELQHPCGIAVDQYNNILIADSGNSRIHLLDNKGRLIDYVLTWEDGIAEPQALCINQHGHLVLTEATTGKMNRPIGLQLSDSVH